MLPDTQVNFQGRYAVKRVLSVLAALAAILLIPVVGHATAWFGVEDNNQNFVTHFIANSTGTLGNGSPLTIHQEGQFTLNAQGLPVVTRGTATCGRKATTA